MLFSDYIGQERWQRYFKQALSNGRISHAYLLSGPRHIGKRTFAWALARALSCQATSELPCGRCASCQAWLKSTHSHPDVVTLRCNIDASVIGIDEVRRFVISLRTSPLIAPRRLALIEDVDSVTLEGLNVLLKTLEEPPTGVVLLVVSDSSAPLLSTVRSRLQECIFAPVTRGALARALEKRGVSRATADELAALAQGRPGLALHWHKQPQALAAHEAEGKRFINLCLASLSGRFSFTEEVATVDQMDAKELKGLVGHWLSFLRDCLVTSCGEPSFVAHVSLRSRLDALVRAKPRSHWLTAYFAGEFLETSLARNANRRLALNTFFLTL